MKRATTYYLLLLLLAGIIQSCGTTEQTNEDANSTVWAGQQQQLILGFEDSEIPADLTDIQEATLQLVSNGVTEGEQALQVNFQGDTSDPGLTFRPETPIDASSFNHFCLVFDATNTTDVYSAQLIVTVENTAGERIRRSGVVGAGKTQNFYFTLGGEYYDQDKGLRDNPNPWGPSTSPLLVRGLRYAIDFSEIAAIHFHLIHPIADKTVILDNIRLVESPPLPEDLFEGLADKYGQAAKVDFPGKISSDEELQALAKEELQQLAEEGTMAGRSQFGGWSDGPKLEATGFFRTEKVDDTWALVDPEGYLFFSNGIANVRMANTTTFTGVDFRNDTVRYRDPEDVTPEDSRGMVALSEEVTSTAYEAYPWRRKMFLELPSYDDPLANHFSYRREQHIGPFEHGETFSFYQANLERRYGEPTPGAHLEKWVDVTLDRFLNWGFTSFGNWAGYEFYHENRMPYFANGWIIGDFKTVRSGMDYWGPMPDVFDPEFTRRAKVTVAVVAEEVQGNPWCIGVFIDNEKSWGVPHSVSTKYGIPLHALALDAADSPVKAQFVQMLRDKYSTIGQLNESWEKEIEDWASLEAGIDYLKEESYTDEMVADLSMMLEAYATKYFQVVHDALAEVMPDHLYLGCRFASWGMSAEVRRAAQQYVDVFSYNYYEEAIDPSYWQFLEEIDRPSLIGEFHMGTLESSMYHPGIVHAANQEDRARMYTKYMETVIDNPYFVGAHWFQYIDSPLTGRAHDGENYNVGFVRTTDVPYQPMVDAAKRVNTSLYQRRFGQK